MLVCFSIFGILNTFCDDLSKFWFDGKNAMSACCVCGGGTHVPVAPSDLPSSQPSLEPLSTHSAVPTNGPGPSEVPTSAPSTIQFEKCIDFEDFATHDADGFWTDHSGGPIVILIVEDSTICEKENVPNLMDDENNDNVMAENTVNTGQSYLQALTNGIVIGKESKDSLTIVG